MTRRRAAAPPFLFPQSPDTFGRFRKKAGADRELQMRAEGDKNGVMQKKFLRKVEKSQTLLLNEQSRRLQREGRNVYKFGFGQSPFLPPQAVIERLQSAAHLKDYSPVQGIPELREAVARFHRELDGVDIEAGEVLIAPGSKILLYAVMAAFTKADVLVPVPSWVSYIPQAQLAGHTVIKIPTLQKARWRLTPELLEKAVKSKMDAHVPSILILNYPGNPDGLTYASDELAGLAAVARQHNILILSDEIYGLLNHTGSHESIARHCPDNTIITSGLSKWAGAGGWRLGVALLPKALSGAFKETLLGIASETYSCATTPVQVAACEAYRSAEAIGDYVKHQRRILSALGLACYHKLHKSGVDVCEPQGGFYLFLDFSKLEGAGIATSEALCEKLLADTGVILLPGTAFGMEPHHLSARLAYVDFDGVKALEASKKIGLQQGLGTEYAKEYFSRTWEGIDKICEWVQNARK
jgi:aspartate aminotransferase